MAEAGVARRAADPHDEGGVLVGPVVGIGIARVVEHAVQVHDAVDVAGVHPEQHPRAHLVHVIGDGVLPRVELEEGLGRRQEVLLGRGDGGGVVQCDLVEVGNGGEHVFLAAPDRRHHFIALHEGRHERGHVRAIDDTVQHRRSNSFGSLGLLLGPMVTARERLCADRSPGGRKTR